jgi:hypothetical protein
MSNSVVIFGQLSEQDFVFPAPPSSLSLTRVDEYDLLGLTAGIKPVITLTRLSINNYDPYLQIIRVDTGTVEAFNDDIDFNAGNTDSRIDSFTPQPGVSYRIRVTSSGESPFTLNQVNAYKLEVTVPSGNNVVVNPRNVSSFGKPETGSTVTINGQLDKDDAFFPTSANTATRMDEYHLSGFTVGTKPTISISSSAFSPFIEVIKTDVANNSITVVDSSSSSVNFFTFEAGASYRVRVRSLTPTLSVDQPNPYRLEVTVPTGQISVSNDDGKPDLIIHNAAQNWNGIWFMNGANIEATAGIPSWDGWEPAATGDFNQDDHTDIVMHNPTLDWNVVWYMQDTTVAGIGGLPSWGGWEPIGTGDFNLDGKTDLFIYNRDNNWNGVWFLDGANLIGSSGIPAWGGWEPISTGDFNQDGNADVVMYNPTQNWNAIWYMQGTTVGGIEGFNAWDGWRPIGTSDLNQDGYSDVIIHNDANNWNGVFYMQGATVAGTGGLPAWDGGWDIVA